MRKRKDKLVNHAINSHRPTDQIQSGVVRIIKDEVIRVEMRQLRPPNAARQRRNVVDVRLLHHRAHRLLHRPLPELEHAVLVPDGLEVEVGPVGEGFEEREAARVAYGRRGGFEVVVGGDGEVAPDIGVVEGFGAVGCGFGCCAGEVAQLRFCGLQCAAAVGDDCYDSVGGVDGFRDVRRVFGVDGDDARLLRRIAFGQLLQCGESLVQLLLEIGVLLGDRNLRDGEAFLRPLLKRWRIECLFVATQIQALGDEENQRWAVATSCQWRLDGDVFRDLVWFGRGELDLAIGCAVCAVHVDCLVFKPFQRLDDTCAIDISPKLP